MIMKIEEVLENIKKRRKEKGYSHEYVADLLNMSQTSYTNLENNVSKLSVERLFEISKVFKQVLKRF